VNPGNGVLASEYETTRDSWKIFKTFFFSCRTRCLAQLFRWFADAVGAGGVSGGAAGSARFDVLRLDEERVPSRDYVGRGKAPAVGERGVGFGMRKAVLIWGKFPPRSAG
jgi:hypothetical protein